MLPTRGKEKERCRPREMVRENAAVLIREEAVDEKKAPPSEKKKKELTDMCSSPLDEEKGFTIYISISAHSSSYALFL